MLHGENYEKNIRHVLINDKVFIRQNFIIFATFSSLNSLLNDKDVKICKAKKGL